MIRMIVLILLLLTSACLAQFDNLESVRSDIESYDLPPIDDSSTEIRLESGKYNVTQTIDLTRRTLVVNGIVELCSTGDHAVIRMAANAKQRRHQNAVNDGRSNLGGRLSGVIIRGVNRGVAIEIGTEDGLCTDEIDVEGVRIYNMDVGLRVHRTRESRFRSVDITNCRRGIEIIDRALPLGPDGKAVGSDGTNNLLFTDCKVLYSREQALVIRDECPTEIMRCIFWKGGLIHCRTLKEGIQPPWVPQPAVLIEGVAGAVAKVRIVPDQWVGPGPESPVVRITGQASDIVFGGFREMVRGKEFVKADPGCKFKVVE